MRDLMIDELEHVYGAGGSGRRGGGCGGSNSGGGRRRRRRRHRRRRVRGVAAATADALPHRCARPGVAPGRARPTFVSQREGRGCRSRQTRQGARSCGRPRRAGEVRDELWLLGQPPLSGLSRFRAEHRCEGGADDGPAGGLRRVARGERPLLRSREARGGDRRQGRVPGAAAGDAAARRRAGGAAAASATPATACRCPSAWSSSTGWSSTSRMSPCPSSRRCRRG